jgi:carboxymethylenebutenolidase
MPEKPPLTAADPDFASLVPEVPFTRRGFVASMVAGGFALAVQPVVAQQVITTDTAGLTAGEVRIPTRDGTLPAYRAQPAKGSRFPVVLVVQEIFGVHEHIKDVCRRLAKLGYQAIAAELFVRQGDPSKISGIPEILSTIVAKVPDAQVMADLDACVAWAKDHGGDTRRLGVTGFCWGGRITWLYAAHNPNLKAGVAWYGRLVGPANEMTPKHPVDLAGQLKAPVLGLYGGEDSGIPVDTVARMQAAIASAGGRSRFILYRDAPHAFHADYRPSYRKETAEDAWRQLQTWFAQHGV